MHYKNGREAKNGDPVVMFPAGASVPVAGILYDARPGVEFCNGKLAQLTPYDPIANLSECLHADDVRFAIPLVVDTSLPKPR